MDQQQQSLVSDVIPESPASVSNIRSGDHLQSLAGKPVLTKYDIQWVLDGWSPEARSLPFTLMRDGRRVEGTLSLPSDWKVGDPADYSWRVRNVYTEHMSTFLPAPGFVGDPLTGAALDALHLPEPTFDLKITRLNQGSHLAGVRRGDVVVSAGGKADFTSPREFYAWCESLRRSGRDRRSHTPAEHQDHRTGKVPAASTGLRAGLR